MLNGMCLAVSSLKCILVILQLIKRMIAFIIERNGRCLIAGFVAFADSLRVFGMFHLNLVLQVAKGI